LGEGIEDVVVLNHMNTTTRKSVSSGDIIPKIIWEALFSARSWDFPEIRPDPRISQEIPGNPRISRISQEIPEILGNPRFLALFSGFQVHFSARNGVRSWESARKPGNPGISGPCPYRPLFTGKM